MSTENITTFLSQVRTNPDLADKTALATAETFASVAREEGLPFTAEEFLNLQKTELSDASLAQVNGGLDLGAALKELFRPYEKGDYSGMRMPLY